MINKLNKKIKKLKQGNANFGQKSISAFIETEKEI